jgi:hypothetical protein
MKRLIIALAVVISLAGVVLLGLKLYGPKKSLAEENLKKIEDEARRRYELSCKSVLDAPNAPVPDQIAKEFLSYERMIPEAQRPRCASRDRIVARAKELGLAQ